MTPRQARLGVDIFTALVVASVGLALASLTWRLAGDPGTSPAAAPLQSGRDNAADLRPILALAPFGAVTAGPAQGGDGQIKLRAIFLTIPSSASSVLIAGADGKVAMYHVGEAVGGGVVDAIEAEQVVIRTPQGPRALGFGPDAAAAAKSANTATLGRGGGVAAAPGGTGAAQPGAGDLGTRPLIPPDIQAKTAPAAAVGNGSAPAQAASGFRVGASPAAALLAAGIRPGDVIQRVNGTPVTSATNERDLIAQAGGASMARLEILRDNQPVSLTVPLR